MGGCPSLRPSSPVQKEEGLREEHGSFPRRKLRRGPRLIKPLRSPHRAAPCSIAPLSRRWADRARPAVRWRNGVSAETPAIRRGKRSPAADAGLGCSKKHPLRERTGGSGGRFAFGVMAPRRPFCPLSAGGKWTHAPQRRLRSLSLPRQREARPPGDGDEGRRGRTKKKLPTQRSAAGHCFM